MRRNFTQCLESKKAKIKLGPHTLKSVVLPAPMSGVTDFPYRKLIAACGGVPCTITEMIASESMVRDAAQALGKVMSIQKKGVLAVVQLAGCKPDVMAEAAQRAVDAGAEIIDINMGCPAKKVVGGFAGSALMRDLKNAKAIIKAVVNAVSVPVTLKMRKGWDDDTLNAPELALIAQEEGVQMITLHARTRCQFYKGQADWPFFKRLKNILHIPVVGNGDIKSSDEATRVIKETGVDAVMIGRGCYGKPWIFKQINERLLAEPTTEVTRIQKKNLIMQHLDTIYSFYGAQKGVMIARKHLGWYSKTYMGGSAFRSRINCLECPRQAFQESEAFFNNALAA